jgi:DNA polymerase-3 subunit epsilon
MRRFLNFLKNLWTRMYRHFLLSIARYSTKYQNREIILDIETTGLGQGHRIVEIAALEMVNKVLTGKKFHSFINPQRPVLSSFDIHGLTDHFLEKKPVFANVAHAFLHFIHDTTIVAHNAKFDICFLKHELELLNMKLPVHKVIDTLTIAREKFPKQKNSLDALCERYHVRGRQSNRHGALEDAELLYAIYLKLELEKNRKNP